MGAKEVLDMYAEDIVNEFSVALADSRTSMCSVEFSLAFMLDQLRNELVGAIGDGDYTFKEGRLTFVNDELQRFAPSIIKVFAATHQFPDLADSVESYMGLKRVVHHWKVANPHRVIGEYNFFGTAEDAYRSGIVALAGHEPIDSLLVANAVSPNGLRQAMAIGDIANPKKTILLDKDPELSNLCCIDGIRGVEYWQADAFTEPDKIPEYSVGVVNLMLNDALHEGGLQEEQIIAFLSNFVSKAKLGVVMVENPNEYPLRLLRQQHGSFAVGLEEAGVKITSSSEIYHPRPMATLEQMTGKYESPDFHSVQARVFVMRSI